MRSVAAFKSGEATMSVESVLRGVGKCSWDFMALTL
jgi:hypothetical protein